MLRQVAARTAAQMVRPTSTAQRTLLTNNKQHGMIKRYYGNQPDQATQIPIKELEVRQDSHGDWVGKVDGEEVIFPEQAATIEWVLSTPVDLHLFEETPVIKEEPEVDDEDNSDH